MIGHITTELTKQKIGKKAKKRWRNKIFKKMNIAALKKSFNTPEYKRKMRIIYNSKEFKELQRQKFTGEKNPNWKDGRKLHKGYILILCRNHPFANSAGYVREHRLVIEKMLGRYLKPNETPHHLGKKTNNHPRMLMAFTSHSAHIRFHYNPNNVKLSEIIFDGRKLEHYTSL